jgi:hypothetical protein
MINVARHPNLDGLEIFGASVNLFAVKSYLLTVIAYAALSRSLLAMDMASAEIQQTNPF